MDEFEKLFSSEHEEYAKELNDIFMKQMKLPAGFVGKHCESIGGTGSGKTFREKMMLYYWYKDLFNEIIVVSPTAHKDQWVKIGVPEQNLYTQPLTEALLDQILSRAENNFENPPDSAPKFHWSTLIIIDDQGDLPKKIKNFDRKLIYARHHNTSIHTLVQSKIFNSTTARANMHYYLLRPSEWTNSKDRDNFCASRGLINNRTADLSLAIPTFSEAITECMRVSERDGTEADYDYIFIDCDKAKLNMYRGRRLELFPIKYRAIQMKNRHGKNVLMEGEYDEATRAVNFKF